MDFIKSVFADDVQPQSFDQPTDPTPNRGSSATWSFSGLMKSLADKSESVMESCRKEFEESGSGLKKETDIIRTVASRAVNDSLEIGASVAQEKLESVGQTIDDIGSSFWKSTAQIISHGNDTFLSPSDDDNFDSENSSNKKLSINNSSISKKRYSRFEMQIRAFQSDKSTYCTEPEDLEDFENWKLGFNLEERKGEIEDLLNENSVIQDIFNSNEFESKRYWSNYFYKLSRLMKAEEARAKLVKRAISGEEEEDLSWDVDEDDEDEDEEESGNVGSEKKDLSGNVDSEKKDLSENGEKCSKNDEEKSGSCKDSDALIVSSQLSMPEEEGWDEIEETWSSEDNKGEDFGNPNRVDLRKRPSVAEEDEDLSWDIDDDEDEESKSSVKY